MSESLIETRRRIQTIQSTEKITKAMKLVASVKFQKFKRQFDQSLSYANEMEKTMYSVLMNIDLSKTEYSQYLTSFNMERNLYIVITSTLGLCGSYNYNIFKKLDPLLKEKDEIITIGQKAYVHYHDSKYKIYDKYTSLLENFNYDNVRSLRHFIFRLYREEKYNSIQLVYTNYKNSMSFVPTVLEIAPLPLEKIQDKFKFNNSYPPIFEPDANKVADLILPHYADSQLYIKMMESQLSEHASRRNAMETATDNADEILQTLKIEYNKARQNAITQEITEVVGGANGGKNDD